MRIKREGRMHTSHELFEERENFILDVCSRLTALESMWCEIVGDALYYRSVPTQIQYGKGGEVVLLVTVSSSAALQNMNFKKNEIIKKIKEKSSISLSRLEIKMGKINIPKINREIPKIKKTSDITVDDSRLQAIEEQIRGFGIENKGLIRAMARYRCICEQKTKKR